METSLLEQASAHAAAAELAADEKAEVIGGFWWSAAAVLVNIAAASIPGTGVPAQGTEALTCGQHLAAAAATLDRVPAAERPAGLLMARLYLADAIHDVAQLEHVPGRADV